MLRRFKHIGRFPRILILVPMCLMLLAIPIMHRQHMEMARQELGPAVISTSWKISELFYEGEQLSTAIVLYDLADMSLDELQISFDVFWSRVLILRDLNIHDQKLLMAALIRMDALLTEIEPMVFEEVPMDRAALYAFRADLSLAIIDARRAWLQEFSKVSFEHLSPATAALIAEQEKADLLSGLVFMGIVLYLMFELYLGAKAMRRAKGLAEVAHETSRAKSRLIANVSHEIRTPLNGILGTATLLSETGLSPEQKGYVSVLQQAGEVLLATINDVLDYSKLEAGEFAIHPRVFELGDVINAVDGLFAPLARQKDLTLKVWRNDGNTPALYGDAQRLQQVLHNLVSNAIKFTESGQIEVVCTYMPWDSRLKTGGLQIDVHDSGVGIAPDQLDHIFEPFGQTSEGMSRKQGGTGLGLTISRDFCRAMGGDLTVTSVVGEGSVFRLHVPFPVAAVQPKKRASSDSVTEALEEAELEHLKVLIVDDNRTNRFILRKYLAPLGCVLFEAENGRAAIDLAERESLDVILMDAQMPEMSGVEATEILLERRRKTGKERPYVVGVTANTLPEQIEDYFHAGMSEVIPKPVSKATLYAVIRTIAGKHADAAA